MIGRPVAPETLCKAPMPLARVLVLLVGLVMALFSPLPAFAAGVTGASSGLPLPRFATTRSDPINVRVGPGTRYGVAWVYVKPGVPVEIIQEFDTWRKIRDQDGSEGWVHQNLLSGKRAGIVGGWTTEQLAIRASASDGAGVRAWIGPGYRVDISRCDGDWCQVGATDHPPGGRTATYWGYLPQATLWGVYPEESFD